MTTRKWYEVSWRNMVVLLFIPILILVFPMVYGAIFRQPQVACVIEQNGKLIKAWDNDCAEALVRFKRE